MQRAQESISYLIRKVKTILSNDKIGKYIDKLRVFFGSPWVGVLFWIEFLACFGLTAVVETPSVAAIVISICCLTLITFLTTFTLQKIKKQNIRVLTCIAFLSAVILFFSMIYRPYTYSVQLLIMFTFFSVSVFVLINTARMKWIVFILSIVGQAVDSRYVCMMFLPLFLLYSFLEKREKVNYLFWRCCLYVQIIIGVAKIFVMKEDVRDLFFAESPLLHYMIPYFCLFILAYLCTYLIFRKQDRLQYTNMIQFAGIFIVLVLVRFTESGYMYGVMLFLALGIAYIDRIKWNKTIHDYKCDKQWFVLIALCLVWVRHFADLHLLNPIWYNQYAITHYYVDYNHYGFVQRGLIGTIIYNIFGYYISVSTMNVIADIAYAGALLLVVVVLYNIGRNVSENNKKIVQAILLLIAITPAIGGYMDRLIFQSVDVYNLLLGVVCILLLIRKRFVFLVPVFACIGMLNHQIFVFLFFPMIFSVMLYQGFLGDQNKKRYIQVIFWITTIIVFGLFLYIQFYSSQKLKINLDTAIQILRERSGGKTIDNMTLWQDVIFKDLSTHLNKFRNDISGSMVADMIISLLYSSPLIVLYVYAYVVSIKKETQKSRKMAYAIMMLSVLAVLPCYILETDYFRWTTNLLFMLFMGILVLTIVQKNEKSWYSNIDENKLETWMLCIAIMLGCYQDMGFSVY